MTLHGPRRLLSSVIPPLFGQLGISLDVQSVDRTPGYRYTKTTTVRDHVDSVGAMSQIPSIMKALVGEKGTAPSIREVSVPKIGANEVLIKIEYAAQNPTDWKHAASISPPSSIAGCDFSGIVVSTDNSLTVPLKIGDKVAGCIHGGLWPDEGSFAEYAKAQSDLVFEVPEGLNMEEASTYGVPWMTACHALIYSQEKDWPPASVPKDTWYLIYGASSAVGLFAIQLAKMMGYRVIAICSPHNFSLVKSYGAVEVADYHDAARCQSEVKRISGGGVDIGLDTISEGDSFRIALGCFGEKGGRLNAILSPKDEDKAIRKDVEVVNTLMYTLLGKPYKMGPYEPGVDHSARAFGVEFCKRTPDLIKQGIKCNPVKLRGTLNDVIAGFEDMKAGKVSGQKLVYKIAS